MMVEKIHENARLIEKLPAGNFSNLPLFMSRCSADHGYFRREQDG